MVIFFRTVPARNSASEFDPKLRFARDVLPTCNEKCYLRVTVRNSYVHLTLALFRRALGQTLRPEDYRIRESVLWALTD